MTLVVNIVKNKEVSQWCEYKDAEGNVLAEFKIRGIAHKAYQVAIERANNQVSSKGFDVSKASSQDKTFHELLFQAAACHLIEDWKGISFRVDEEEVEQPYTPENACKLLAMGDIGPVIFAFVRVKAEQIQTEADKYRDEVLGKSENSTNTLADTQDSANTK